MVRVQAEKVLLEDLNSGKCNKEYLPVTGLADFLNVTSQVCAPVYPCTQAGCVTSVPLWCGGTGGWARSVDVSGLRTRR